MTIQAVFFDLDGLLVDSEPYWRDAEIDIFRTVGLKMTEAMCKETTGLPTDAVVRYWYERHPWQNRSLEDVGEDMLQKAHASIGQFAGPMPGVPEVLQFFQERGIPLVVASASPMYLIETVLDRLSIRKYFAFWHSATLEKRNKPHPDVYLGAARKLQAEPKRCIAFEDSGNGLKSAHEAGMLTVAVPAEYEYTDSKFDLAMLKIPSLTVFDQEAFLALVSRVQKVSMS